VVKKMGSRPAGEDVVKLLVDIAFVAEGKDEAAPLAAGPLVAAEVARQPAEGTDRARALPAGDAARSVTAWFRASSTNGDAT
jgi:hypothetical protein